MRPQVRRLTVRHAPLFALSLMPLMLAATAQAAPVLPTGGKVTAGVATIGAPSSGSLVVNQSSGKAIIDWTGFSIGAGGAVQFNNGSGATLNRVTGTSLSSIDGLLSATGSVYLINPNGVIIGKTGVVNVGGTFVASTLNLSDANFLAGGDLSFTGGSTASVINLGRIGALGGDVALIAAQVGNDGTISAADGTAGLVAGHGVLMRDAALDDGKFTVLVGGAGTSVTNDGMIQAANAELRAEGGNVYALAGATAGVIRATGVKSGDGKIWLGADGGALDVAGTIEAQGANGAGGRIETSGQTVNLGAASINAHGGSWLVDPTDLTIDATAAATISAALNNDTSVTEQTTASGSSGSGVANASGNGDIIVAAPISWATAAGLTLSAYRNIDVNAAITASNGGALTLVTDNSGVGNGGTLAFAPGASVQFTGTTGGQPTGSLAIGVGTGAPTPYVLVSDLTTLSNDIAANNSGAFALATSVDGSNAGAGYTTASPLTSTSTTAFAGTLEGLGNSITNLTINDPTDTNVGLFAQIGATGVVRDLNLTGGSVTGGDTVGSLAGENDGSLSYVTASTAVTASDATNDGAEAGGLVGYNTGTINLSSASGAVSGYVAIGGLVGIDNAASSTTPGVIENSFATGQVTTGSGLAGGLVGQAYGAAASGAQFINDHATGSVSDTGVYGTDSPGQDGGLIGDLLAGVVTTSYATGDVTSTQGFAVGGLIGYAGRTGNVTISDSYATGSVTAFNDAGGLIGEVRAPEDDSFVTRPGVLTITSSYATGSAIATSYDAGGLIGGLYQEASTSGNGTYGPPVSNANTVISNVFATGFVYSPSMAGGLIGKNPGTVTITKGYYDTDTTGQTTDASDGMGMTTAQLQSALPSGFSSSIWGILANTSYPYLLFQFATGATPEVISGTDYDVASNNTFASLVGVVRNGTALGQVSTGANGYYYLLAAPSGNAAPAGGAVQDSILTYQANGSAQGESFVQTNNSNPQATNMTIYGNGLLISTLQSSLSALVASLASDAAALPAGQINFTLPSGGVTTSAANTSLLTSTDFTLDGSLNVGSGNLNLAINGALTQTAGVITAHVLTGSATSFNLPGANLVTTLGNSYGVGLTATSGLVFTNAQALTVTGPVAGGAGTTAISTTSGDLTINGAVSGDLTLSSAGNLNINADVAAMGDLTLRADSSGLGAGVVSFSNGATVSSTSSTGGAGTVEIYSDAASGSNGTVNTTEYSSATNYGADVTTGTLTSYMLVNNVYDLQNMQNNLAGSYALGGNIDASATAGWNGGAGFVPVGDSFGSTFTGTLNGLGHTISTLTINQAGAPAFVGLFGLLGTGATVENLGLLNFSIKGVGYDGSTTGAVGTIAGLNDGGTVTAIYSTGSVSSTGSYAGGLVGWNEVGSISDSWSYASVSASGSYAGGITGANEGSVSSTTFGGAVVSNGQYDVGGITGYNSGTIQDVYSTGSVTSSAQFVGGVVGLNVGTVSDVYGTAVVSGNAAGTIAGGNGTGGTITNGYYDTEGAGQATSVACINGSCTSSQSGYGVGFNGGTENNVVQIGASTGLSPYAQSTYTGFDFSSTGPWVILEGSTRPLLKSEYSTTITNAHQLQLVVLDPTATYTLAGNIDASGTTNPSDVWSPAGFAPIGNASTAFTGSLQGGGYAISGLTETPVTGTRYVGLFGDVGAGGAVSNLTLTNAAITGYGYTGALVGDLSGTISNVNVSGTVNGPSGTGGLVGVAEANSLIQNAVADVTVQATGSDAGGLVGASFGTLSNDIAAGQVTSSGGYVGGLVGLNYGTITGSQARGAVTGNEYVGGLVGWNDAVLAGSGLNAPGVITGSSAEGAVTSTAGATAGGGDYVGGLVGVNKGAITASSAGPSAVTGSGLVGGLVGLNQGTIATSFTAAPTTGELYVGGLVGWNDTGATVQTSYATGSVTGLPGGQDASGNDYAGGAVGVNFGAIADIYETGAVQGVQVVGGLVGTNMPGASTVSSYALGPVSASGGAVGGLFGVNAGEATYVYGFPSLSGQPVETGYQASGATGGGTSLSTSQENGSAAYTGFDFTSAWTANPNGPPTLQQDQPAD